MNRPLDTPFAGDCPSRLCSGVSGWSLAALRRLRVRSLAAGSRIMLSFASLSFTLIPMGWDVRPSERLTTHIRRAACSSSRMHGFPDDTAREADAGSAFQWLASNSLKLATRSGNADLVKALIAAGASLEDGGDELQRPLEYAVSYNGKADVVKALIEAGASLETAGGDELTPLEYAIDDGNADVVKVLIEAGASLEAAGEDDFTALKYATHVGNVDVIKVLIEAGASPEDAGAHGGDELTPLKFAIHNENVDVVKALIDAGASLEAAGGEFTPLECAIYNGNVDVVKVLIEAGASLEAVDGDELTPLKYGAAACSPP